MFLSERTPFELSGKCGIYMIRNIRNRKVYVGQTRDLHRRAVDYRRLNDPDFPAGTRPIEKAIQTEGIENFEFIVLKFCNFYELSKWEEYYARKLNALDPDYGYNLNPIFTTNRPIDVPPSVREKMSKSHTGLKETAKTKRKKSNQVFAVTDNIIFVCDSGKVLGDFLGTGKDVIKNCLRQPSRHGGYRIYYADFEKRNEIVDRQIAKLNAGGRGVARIDRGYIEIGRYLNQMEASLNCVETNRTPDGKYIVSRVTYENVITSNIRKTGK